MYRYELHSHMAESSPCAKIPAADMVAAYYNLGYQGMCITDHMAKEFTDLVPDEKWQDRVTRYLKGYYAALEAGDRLGMDIILGMEVTFRQEPFCDYLVFGIDEQWIRNHENIIEFGIERFYRDCGSEVLIIQAHPFRRFYRDCGNKVIQAHPFRINDTIHEDYFYFHGVEVINRHPRSENRNDLAIELALKHPEYYRICGSDAHRPEDIGRTAFLTERRTHDSIEMKKAIESRDYLLWHNEWEENGKVYTQEEICSIKQ